MFAANRTPQSRRGSSWRLVWIVPAGFSLLAGLNAGLLLLGLPAPVTTTRLPEVHGVLLVLGFVATLIALERATALGRWYGFAVPGVLGLGGVLLVVDAVPLVVGQSMLVAGTAAFAVLYIPLWRRRFDNELLVQLLAAALACLAAILWLSGASMDRVIPWLFAFVVLTIAAERVELASISMAPGASNRLLIHAWSITVALIIGVPMPQLGAILLGVTLLALVIWLLIHDVARRTIRAKGVTRYMAACLLGGYVWLVVAGVILLFGFPSGRPAYDAAAHAVFLGFTMSMIMAHATTILPAVLGIRLPYHPLFWVPAVTLHVSLVIRIWFGDGFDIVAAWHFGGVLGVIALLLFMVTAIGSAVAGNAAGRRKVRT
ncbi:MAG: hypothetical protein ACTHW3_07280 [Leucobacter sp.]